VSNEKSPDWQTLPHFDDLNRTFQDEFFARVDAYDVGWLRDNLRIILVLQQFGKSFYESIEVFPHSVTKTYTGFEVIVKLSVKFDCMLELCAFLCYVDGVEMLLESKPRKMRLRVGQSPQISFTKATI